MKEVKRVLIAGCRTFNNYAVAKQYINHCISNIRKDYSMTIISGGADGADKLGKRYAEENGFEIEYYLPDGKNTAGQQVLAGIKKWLNEPTILYAFGTVKAEGQHQL